MSKLTLSEKIFRITQACSEIKRNGVGESSDPNKPLYPYVKIEDVLAVVNPLLKRYKLILTGTVAKEPVTHVGKTFATTEVLVDWTLQHAEGWGDGTVEQMVESRTWTQGNLSTRRSREAANIFMLPFSISNLAMSQKRYNVQTSRNLPSLLNDGYPRQIRISEYDPHTRRMVDKLYKVYSANDEAMVRTWHDDMNRKLQSQQRRDDCAAKA